jgi:hypothetical protein
MTDGTNTYRVVQWSAGRMGKKSLRAVVDHPDLELVGLYVYSEDATRGARRSMRRAAVPASAPRRCR